MYREHDAMLRRTVSIFKINAKYKFMYTFRIKTQKTELSKHDSFLSLFGTKDSDSSIIIVLSDNNVLYYKDDRIMIIQFLSYFMIQTSDLFKGFNCYLYKLIISIGLVREF
ncbi:MAG: hypothetical protein Barrevirus18_13 [Barrevirus sp.]|uniref:Uncharacterized protein n=1 Tax=Barrevirus sp. TaxID=2487763 RepID=A0A3G4ZUU4_9VIRU|nr:MAG: hypothetical protein Barrevirus18_13 [Barrevirus sp.]